MNKFLLCVFSLLLFSQNVLANPEIPFGPEASHIKGSIKYSVIGRYSAVFDQYDGHLNVDPETQTIRGVFLEIKSASIHSKNPSLDKIVRSKQLLDVSKFPLITFQSQAISKVKDGYQVIGDLTLHGVKKAISSPFSVVTAGDGSMTVKGEWLIKRKEFDIIWNRLLDRGGILVGDIITVNWEIKIPKGVVK